MYIGLYIKYRYSCQILMKLEVSRHIFEKFSNIKLYINPPIGSRVAPCGRTYITKLIVVSRNFANAPKHLLNTPISNSVLLIMCIAFDIIHLHQHVAYITFLHNTHQYTSHPFRSIMSRLRICAQDSTYYKNFEI